MSKQNKISNYFMTSNQNQKIQIVDNQKMEEEITEIKLPCYYKSTWNQLQNNIKSFLCQENCIEKLESFILNNRSIIKQKQIQHDKCLNNLQIILPEIADKSELIKYMCQSILNLQEIFNNHSSIKLLKQGQQDKIELNRKQVFALNCCMFLGCFDLDKKVQKNFKANVFNYFIILERKCISNLQKIKCLINYFECIFEQKQNDSFQKEIIIYQRQNVSTNYFIEQLSKSQKILQDIQILEQGTIEDDINNIQLDFANKQLGGGVLTYGLIQEEIRFTISPELMISIFLCEVMQKNEAVIIYNTIIYSKYEGYGDSFKFYQKDQSYHEQKNSIVSCIDAKYFEFQDPDQYSMNLIHRELVKSFIGFKVNDIYNRKIASGKWGCGAFNGDKYLKLIIQWISASLNNRTLIYYTFQDNDFEPMIKTIQTIREKQHTVQFLYKFLQTLQTRKDLNKICLRTIINDLACEK